MNSVQAIKMSPNFNTSTSFNAHSQANDKKGSNQVPNSKGISFAEGAMGLSTLVLLLGFPSSNFKEKLNKKLSSTSKKITESLSKKPFFKKWLLPIVSSKTFGISAAIASGVGFCVLVHLISDKLASKKTDKN